MTSEMPMTKTSNEDKIIEVIDDLHPNKLFFQKYGSFEDSNSMTSRSQFLLIRHGTSVFNVKDHDFKKELWKKYPENDEESKLKKK